ncbi:Lrp/AsnC family transcriptional regulator [Parahaliea mediterranea]|uniref:Lrp/AsnC family transcriptional regulator n=1 Tax=Parahaliea mediterranea TaxID=651086 RepID=A0A939IL49_9GAMM|nr:Lrp/AsnC family transcriptional regulator [Parahaliea mediterranea]MBN7795602.1 Lrp/AsnC family transcriptional regulator [Parahaliea mediterranea]
MGRDTPAQVDDIDTLLMSELEKDGRLPIADLARKAGITRTTARKRLAALIDNELISIVGWSNPFALGYNLNVIMGLSVQHKYIDDIASELKARSFVQSVIVTTGRFDMMVWAFFRDQQHLGEFLKRDLGSYDAITDIDTMMILEVEKAFTKLLSS